MEKELIKITVTGKEDEKGQIIKTRTLFTIPKDLTAGEVLEILRPLLQELIGIDKDSTLEGMGRPLPGHPDTGKEVKNG